MKTNRLFLLIVLLPLFCIGQNNYSIVYEADKKGEAISGDINVLLKSVQNGNPVRVGWVLKLQDFDNKIHTIEHWVDAGFLTIENNHVFAQIKPIYEQGLNFDESSVYFVTGKPNGWVSIISTTGVMKQKFSNIILDDTEEMTKEEIKKMIASMETMRVITKWAVPKG